MSTLREILKPQELLANAVQACVKQQSRILIIGTKPGNLPAWTTEHPQILLWESNGTEVERASAIPDGVGAVLFLKWIGHRQHKRILDAARRVAPFVYAHPALLGTGEVRRLIAPLAPETAQPVVTPTPAGQPSWEGSLFGFVEKHYEHGIDHGHQKAEAERILRLAYAHGLTTTLGSVQATVSTVHRGIERERENARLASMPPPPDVPELLAKPLDPAKVAHLTTGTLLPPEKPPVAEKPSVKALVAAGAASEAQVDTSLTELLRMLDDAVAVLGLAREQLVDLSTKNRALRESREALRAKIMGVFEGI